MTTKNYFILVVVLLVGFGVGYFTHGTKTTTIIKDSNGNTEQVVAGTVENSNPLFTLGLKAGPKAVQVIDSSANLTANSSITNGGIQVLATTQAMIGATTTPCAILSSATATTTLSRVAVDFSVSTSVASIITLAKSNTAYATTTNLQQYAIPANGQASITASSSIDTVFSPCQYFVVGMQGGVSGGTFSPTGNCQTKFTVSN